MSFSLKDLDEDIRKALNTAYSAGILATVTAGNVPQNSVSAFCGYAVTVCVGATDRNYYVWKNNDKIGSSYGPDVKIWAPGHDVESTSADIIQGLERKTETSMAAPMVAGVLAGFISHEHLSNNPKTVLARLTSNQLINIIQRLPYNSHNNFLNNGRGQTRNLDIPYLGAPERGWDTFGGVPNKDSKVASNESPKVAPGGDVAGAQKHVGLSIRPLPTNYSGQ
jgi:hypothetical protein